MAVSSADELAVIDVPSGYHFGTMNELKTRQVISYEYGRGKTATLTVKHRPLDAGNEVPLFLLSQTANSIVQARDAVSKAALDRLITPEFEFLHSLAFQQIWEKRYQGQEQTYGFALPTWKVRPGKGAAPIRSSSSVESCASLQSGSTASLPTGPSSPAPAASSLHVSTKFWVIGNRMPQEEGRKVEYKAYSWDAGRMRDMACKVVCSFLNSKGGSLFFGVDDNCNIVGTKASSKQLDEFNQFLNEYLQHRFDPPLDIGFYTITSHQVYHPDDTIAQNTWVIQLEVSKVHKYEVYFFLEARNWKAYFRRDGTVQEMLPSQFKRVLRKPILALKEAISYA